MDNSNYPQQSSGKAVACLILGICSIVFGCSGIIGLVCAIIDMVMAKKVAEESFELPKQAKIGKILGIIGLVISILGLLFWIIWGGIMGAAVLASM